MGDYNIPEHPGGVTALVGCNERSPRGTHPAHGTLSPGTKLSVATPAGWPCAQGPGRGQAEPQGRAATRGAVPWLNYIFCLSDASVRLGGINFSVAVGKVTGLIKWYTSLRAWRARHHRGDGSCCNTPARPSVPPVSPPRSPPGAVTGATQGGRPAGAGGLAVPSTAAGAISIPETRLHSLNKKQTQN